MYVRFGYRVRIGHKISTGTGGELDKPCYKPHNRTMRGKQRSYRAMLTRTRRTEDSARVLPAISIDTFSRFIVSQTIEISSSDILSIIAFQPILLYIYTSCIIYNNNMITDVYIYIYIYIYIYVTSSLEFDNGIAILSYWSLPEMRQTKSDEINKRFAIKGTNHGDQIGKVHAHCTAHCRVDAFDGIMDVIARRRAKSNRDSMEEWSRKRTSLTTLILLRNSCTIPRSILFSFHSRRDRSTKVTFTRRSRDIPW